MAPFRQLFAFVFFDSDFDTAEDSFANLADGAAQSIYRLGRVEVEHRHEVLRAKVCILHQTTPGKQGVGGADGGCVDERHAFVIVMILFQIRSVNDAENVLLMGKEVFGNLHRTNLFQLVGEIAGIPDTVLLLQSMGNNPLMLWAEFPEVGAAGALCAAGVRYIKHIPEPGSIPGVVNEGNTFRTPANITTHSFVPQFIIRTGGGFRVLGVDHKLFVIGVLV